MLEQYHAVWIPAIKKVARDRGVQISDEKTIEVINKAEKEAKKLERRGQLIRPEIFASLIHQVFKDELEVLAERARKENYLFPSGHKVINNQARSLARAMEER